MLVIMLVENEKENIRCSFSPEGKLPEKANFYRLKVYKISLLFCFHVTNVLLSTLFDFPRRVIYVKSFTQLVKENFEREV